MKPLRLGVHVSIAGKLWMAVERAHALGCNAMQIFSRNPRGWRAGALDPEEVCEFKERRARYGIETVVVHVPYIFNLATPENSLYRQSVRSFIEDLIRADALGADYFVSHMGSHMGAGEPFGLARLSEALNTAIEKAKPRLTILMENTAGSGQWLCYKFEHFAKILARVKKREKVGVCLDTCHTFTAGYDISTPAGFRKTVKELDDAVGLETVKVIHLNDSKAPLGARVDRHEHIGRGKIGLQALGRVVTHPRLGKLPLILETPKKTERDDPMNLAAVRAFAHA